MATTNLSYPLVSSPDPSTAQVQSFYGTNMQQSISSSSSTTSFTTQTQPTLRKARSRHFDMFQSNVAIPSSSAAAPQPPSAQSYAPYSYIDPYSHGYEDSNVLANQRLTANLLQQYNNPTWSALPNTIRASVVPPYVRYMEHSPPIGPNDVTAPIPLPPLPSQTQYSPPASLSPTRSEVLPSYILPPLPTSADLIPNAIVIKSIPFAVSADEFLEIILAAGVPRPYAFNYHIDDKGKFRGLAFANFSTVDDARLALAVLNGYEVYKRKLRAEYKKMLPREERERIEREKRMRRGQLEEQHRQQPQFAQLSEDRAGSILDFNNQTVIDVYSELLLFKNREGTDEIIMGPLTLDNRRIAHQVADKLGLGHKSMMDGSILVTRTSLFQQQQHALLHRQSLSSLAAAAAAAAAAQVNTGHSGSTSGSSPTGMSSQDSSSATSASSRQSMYAPLPVNATGTASALLDYKALPQHKSVSPKHTLRGTKSFADIRSSSRVSALYTHQNGSSSSINSHLARSSASAASLGSSIPAVPVINAVLGGQLSGLAISGAHPGEMHHPKRQPLAPDASGGFMGLQSSVLRE
ncbi:uncharacterized protein V1513DRAFT_425987 [Lipomyces chichibuensis]|uniref:uncharacterized protein n=1 Tax=Lipomyces chichibuensis TaxID=1546026 RepID=UPI003342FB64